MKSVPRRKLTTIGMVAGNEKKYGIVVDGDTLKQWVGIGWVELRKATAEDRRRYPKVV